MFRTILLAAAAATILAACSTTVKETPPAGMSAPAVATSYMIGHVSGSATAAKVPAGTAEALAQALRIETAGSNGPPANLNFVISDYRVVSRAARFMVGALAGSNRMTVDVTLTSPAGAVVRQFQVTRAANTMGVGAFMNQKGSLVSETAEAIAKSVGGEKP